MKRLIKLFVIIIACFSLSFITASSFEYKNSSEPKYVISDYNGNLAVFKYGDKSPLKVYNVYTSSFPKEEQTSIINGKKIYSEKDLQKLLEAYLS